MYHRGIKLGRSSLRWVTLTGLALAMIALPERGEAARPLITDDARIVDAKACQLETWITDDRDNTQWMALPACNFTGNLELTLGAGITREADHTGHSDVIAQANTILKALEPNGFGIGFAAGVAHYPESPDDERDWYAYVPMSFALHGDVALAHVNLGWQREGGTGRDHLTWGVAGEFQLTQRTALVAETFAQQDDEAFYQVGLRQWLVMNRVQLDATYGNRDGGGPSERWFSVGLRFLSVPFLP